MKTRIVRIGTVLGLVWACAAAAGPASGGVGVRASVGGSGISSGGGFSPSVGVAYFPTDSVGLTFDLGFSISAAANSPVSAGFGVGAGANFYVGSRTGPVIPFVTVGLGFGKTLSTRADFALQFDVGGGVEYWVTDHFSLSGTALLVVPLSFPQGGSMAVTVATVSPFLGATFYF